MTSPDVLVFLEKKKRLRLAVVFLFLPGVEIDVRDRRGWVGAC